MLLGTNYVFKTELVTSLAFINEIKMQLVYQVQIYALSFEPNHLCDANQIFNHLEIIMSASMTRIYELITRFFYEDKTKNRALTTPNILKPRFVQTKL